MGSPWPKWSQWHVLRVCPWRSWSSPLRPEIVPSVGRQSTPTAAFCLKGKDCCTEAAASTSDRFTSDFFIFDIVITVSKGAVWCAHGLEEAELRSRMHLSKCQASVFLVNFHAAICAR